MLSDVFHTRYAAQYGRSVGGVELEILTISLRIETQLPPPRHWPEPASSPAPPPLDRRPVFDATSGTLTEAPIYWRPDLPPGTRLPGPTVIAEPQTSTLIPAQFDAHIDAAGNIVCNAALPAKPQHEAIHRTVADRRQVMWNRLVSIVEEQAQTLIRIAFSTAVREAGDLSAGIFDTAGRMIAQAVTGTPGHVNSMAISVGHFLARHPADSMRPGDVFLTNDPWLGTGHLFDFTVVTRPSTDGRLVSLFACTAHVVDIGGIGFGADGRRFTKKASAFRSCRWRWAAR